MDSPSQEAVERLENAVTRSKRTSSVRLPLGFARDSVAKRADPPLARLLRGGGEARLKVLLTLTMMATKHPHTKQISSRDIAEMLGYPAPEGAGGRRAAKAIADLVQMGLLRREVEAGHVPTITVLDPAGSGEEWDARALPTPYITLPIELYRRGWLIALSGRSVALLVILRELTQGRKTKGTFADGVRKRQYGFSDDWWTDASNDLKAAGLVTWVPEVRSSRGEARLRHMYTLHLERLSLDPTEAAALAEESDEAK